MRHQFHTHQHIELSDVLLKNNVKRYPGLLVAIIVRGVMVDLQLL